MYDSVGKQIQKLATILCIVGCIASIIVAVVLGHAATTISVILGLVVMMIGCFGSWAVSLILRGFGHLIVTVDQCEAYLRYQEKMNKPDVLSGTEEKQKATIVTAKKQTIVPEDASRNSNSVSDMSSCSCRPRILDDETLECIFCHTKQNRVRTTCSACGARFMQD